MSTKKLRTKDIDDNYDLKDTTLGISGMIITKYEDKNENKELKTGIKIPQTNVEYDRKEKGQVIRTTISNVEVLKNGEKVDLITRGINTDKEKSQEIIKDDEKYFDAPLHTDLLNKEEREKLVEDFKKTVQLPAKIVDGINYNNTKQYAENGELVNKKLGTSISASVRDMNIDVVIKTDENRKDYEEALSKTLNEKGEYADESLLLVQGIVEQVLAEKGIEADRIVFTTNSKVEGSNAKTNGKNFIINLNSVDISNFDNVVELAQYEGQRFSYKDKLEDDVAVYQGIDLPNNLGSTKISSESMILSHGNEFVENEDLKGYRDRVNEGAEYYNKDLRNIKRLNGNSKYTSKEIQEEINWWFGENRFKVDWNKYSNNSEYREQVNYYYFQARFALRAKSVDKIDENYVTITQTNGKKMKLKKIPANQSIYHNIEYKNNTAYFYFDDRYRKYVQDDGYELILDKNGNPVYDPSITGTYNFHTYSSIINWDALRHLQTDVKLWIKYGSGPTDKTTMEIRENVGDMEFGKFIQDNFRELKALAIKMKKESFSYEELIEIRKRGIDNYGK